MDQLKTLFASLSLAQKIALGVVILLVGAGIPMFTKWQHESNFKPLFTGMAPEDAGAIIAKLKETGVEHKLAENGTAVLVPSDKVDEVRLELAGAGLPKTGRIGYELFDKTNLSLTDFGERVNYRRAVEGELEKTIKSINDIDQARVHVTFPNDSVFLDARKPAKASVLLHVKPGARLQPQNVTAVANLVASAVEGLSPDMVSIVDMQGNLLSHRRKPSADGSDTPENTLEYKDQVEKDLTSKVEATLEPLLGEGRFRVGITAECDFSTSEQTDEIYDPSRSVIANSTKSEDMSQGGGAAGGMPGTPSNLPRSQIKAQTAGTQAGGSSSGSTGPTVSRKVENVTFDPTRTVRHTNVPRGVIKKISAALLIDQDVEWQGKGKDRKRVFIPPTEERLKTIREVVGGVLGITADRGDQLVVQSLPFEQTRTAEDTAMLPPKPTALTKMTIQDLMANKKVLIGAGVGLLFIVLLLFFVMRRPKAAPASAQLMEKTSIAAGRAEPQSIGSAEQPERAAGGSRQVESAGADGRGGNADGGMKELEEVMPSLQLPAMTSHTKVLLEHLRKAVGKDPDAAATVIRAWMEEV